MAFNALVLACAVSVGTLASTDASAQSYPDPNERLNWTISFGPGGGNEEKPVGTVWIAVSLRDQIVHTQKFHFAGDRNQVRLQAVAAALKALLELVERG